MAVRPFTSPRALSWGPSSFLMLLYCILCRGAKENPPLTPELLRQASELIIDKDPSCFTRDLKEFVCFWESKRPGGTALKYTVEEGEEKTCTLRIEMASADTWWHICEFPTTDIFLYAEFQISVMDSQESNVTLYYKEIEVNNVVLLDAPKNLTVKEKWKPWGLLVSWEPPNDNLKKDIKYQLSYSPTDSEARMVEVDAGTVEHFLTDLTADTEYTIRVRAHINNMSYSGYWSEWTDPVTIEMTNVWDALHILLFVISGLVLFIALCLLSLCQGRFIKHKVWPQVPTPDRHFQGLFTTHKGNFKMWLGQADSYLLWVSRNVFHEDPASSLEVLSELPSAALPRSSLQKPSKDSYVVLNENLVPHFPAWLAAHEQQSSWHSAPRVESSLVNPPREGNDWEEALRRQARLIESRSLDTSSREHGQGEALGGENGLLEAPVRKSGLCKVSREDSLSSEEGKQSSPSSFEYTVLETYEGLLSPKPRPLPDRTPLKYAYLLMSDSGEQSPPPSPNIYQNSICVNFPTPVYTEC
ncbi:erythropoietin receptor [Rhinophrynus dorsalis]